MNNKLVIGAIAVAIVLIVGYFIYSGTPEVSAMGQASLQVQPDEISVYVQIETKNATLQDAQKANSEIREKVLENLLAMEIDEENIQFSNYQSYPWSEWNGNKYLEKGYIVSQQIIVKASEFKQAPRIVDKAIEAGALVQSISLELSDEKQNEYKAQALKAASENAKEKAEAIAEGQGKNIGRLLSIESSDFNYVPYPYYEARGGVAASDSAAEAKQAVSSIALEPKELEVSASVSVKYKLSLL